jgi:hypothetical protein
MVFFLFIGNCHNLILYVGNNYLSGVQQNPDWEFHGGFVCELFLEIILPVKMSSLLHLSIRLPMTNYLGPLLQIITCRILLDVVIKVVHVFRMLFYVCVLN